MDSPYESNNLGFEHVDPPVSSTTDESPADLMNEDLYGTDEAEPNTADLLNFESPPPKPTAPKMDPFTEPDTSSFYTEEPAEPEPVAVPEKPKSVPEKKETSPASPCCATTEGSGTCCAWLQNVDPRVLDLIYWRDVKKSGVVFGSTMITLLALAFYSVVSVLAYLALAVMMVTLSFSVYKKVLGAVQKSQDGHPFKQYMDMCVALPEERVHQVVDLVLAHVNVVMANVRRLFLVEDIVDSIKFALMLWVLTYIGSWFNGLTLIILATVTIFTAPKVYQTHKTQIDNYLELAMGHVMKVVEQVKAKIPLPGKKKTQ